MHIQNGPEARKMFRNLFGEVLIPRGFVQYKNSFVRVHPNEVVLMLELQLGRSDRYVNYDLLPMCADLAEAVFMHYRVEMFRDKCTDPRMISMSIEEQFNVFVEKMLERFDGIHDVLSMRNFDQDMIIPIYGEAERGYFRMLESLAMEDYESAQFYVELILERNYEAIEGERKNLDWQNRLTTSRERKKNEAFFEQYKAKIEENIVTLKLWQDRILNKEYNEIEDILRKNRNSSNQLCATLWPSFYQQ